MALYATEIAQYSCMRTEEQMWNITGNSKNAHEKIKISQRNFLNRISTDFV
jgi:hypothetical protein